MDKLPIARPWGDERIRMSGFFIGCVTNANADRIMGLQQLAVAIESDPSEPEHRRAWARELIAQEAGR